VQRQRHASHSPDLAGPHPGAVHHDLARDVAVGGAHARDGAAAPVDRLGFVPDRIIGSLAELD